MPNISRLSAELNQVEWVLFADPHAFLQKEINSPAHSSKYPFIKDLFIFIRFQNATFLSYNVFLIFDRVV